MNLRKQIITTICSLAFAISSFAATPAEYNFSDEALKYKVMYKWGLVNKQAGTAVLSIRNSGDKYITKLTAKSDPWADKFYKVRDTLNGVVVKEGFKPTRYEKIAHEGSDNKRDVVTYKYTGAKIVGECTRRKWDENGNLTRDDKRTLEAYGTTVDMLSAFYYMRALPYSDWKSGHVVTVNIYSGKRKELLTIKYLGTQTMKVDNKAYKCHHISFTFTSDGKTKTSDDMIAWITADSKRIPVALEGSLKVGKVRCLFIGAS
jgi:hypothetical protein